MKNKHSITADELRALVNYDPETGLFTDKAGAPLGFEHRDGYTVLELGDRRLFRANRMAWLYMTGQDPAGVVDHEDFDKANNAWANLRDVSEVDSRRHRRIWGNKALRMKGVRQIARTGAYQARITYGGKQHSLGHYADADLAGHAYNKAAIQHYGEFAVLNPVGRANYGPRGLIPERRRYLNEPKEKRPRGFAALSPERRLELQRKGGKNAQATGKAHQYKAGDPASKEAQSKGGKALHAKLRALRDKEEGES